MGMLLVELLQDGLPPFKNKNQQQVVAELSDPKNLRLPIDSSWNETILEVLESCLNIEEPNRICAEKLYKQLEILHLRGE